MLLPCRGLVPSRIVACGRSCRRPGLPRRSLYCDTPSTKVMRIRRVARCRACRNSPAPCRRALSAVSQPLAAMYRDTRSPPSQPRYNCCIATQLAAARTVRRIAGPLAVSWSCSGRVVACSAVSWRTLARPCALPPSHACHDTMHCIVTQHQNGQ